MQWSDLLLKRPNAADCSSRADLDRCGQRIAGHRCGVLMVASSHVLTVEFLDGELRIPTDEYVTYFAANIPTWDRTPTVPEEAEIFRNVDEWIRLDQCNGYIIEAKRVGLAICLDDR